MNITKLLFFVGTIAALPLYGFLCVTNLDPATGFFSDKGILTAAFYIVIFAVPLLMIVSSTLIEKRLSFSISNSKALAVLAALVGVFMIISGVSHLIGIASMAQYGEVMLSSLLTTGLQIPIAAISGVVFLKLGIGYFKEEISDRSSYGFIFPVVWALITCVEMFRDYPQIAGMPERTLYLLSLLSFTLFLMGQCRILDDIDFGKGVRWISCFGLCNGLFGLTFAAGYAAAFSAMTLPLFDALLAFVMALYCIAFAVNTGGRAART